jgi:hypothetical protein
MLENPGYPKSRAFFSRKSILVRTISREGLREDYLISSDQENPQRLHASLLSFNESK